MTDTVLLLPDDVAVLVFSLTFSSNFEPEVTVLPPARSSPRAA